MYLLGILGILLVLMAFTAFLAYRSSQAEIVVPVELDSPTDVSKSDESVAQKIEDRTATVEELLKEFEIQNKNEDFEYKVTNLKQDIINIPSFTVVDEFKDYKSYVESKFEQLEKRLNLIDSRIASVIVEKKHLSFPKETPATKKKSSKKKK